MEAEQNPDDSEEIIGGASLDFDPLDDAVARTLDPAVLARCFSQALDAILITDGDNQIVAINASFSRMTGYALAEVRGQDPRIFASGLTAADTFRAM
ncbi:MAG TPA: PAS domain S-box protein, partial [Rhodocyclaceae bacterium]|nr:PAS domain S-box protein [Rhodocyclaceae bacterium]